MTDPILDPDELPEGTEIQDANYHDEEQEIRNDEEHGLHRNWPVRSQKNVRRPPPRKRFHEEY